MIQVKQMHYQEVREGEKKAMPVLKNSIHNQPHQLFNRQPSFVAQTRSQNIFTAILNFTLYENKPMGITLATC